MKLNLKKLAGIAAAVTTALAMTVTTLAAPSVASNGVVGSVTSATDKNGNAVTVTIGEVPAEYAEAVAQVKDAATLKALLGSKFVEGMSVVDVKEVSVPEGTEFPVTLTFAVPGVTAGSNAAVLHYNGSAWEEISCTAGDGTITATFSSLSPVAFVVGNGPDGTGTVKASPKTGEFNMVTTAAVIALMAVCAGLAFFARRKRA